MELPQSSGSRRLCPLDWPTNYSLLRLWHHPTSLHQFADLLYKQLDHRHMFTQWSLDLNELAERAMFQQPATYFTDAALQEHWRDLDFPSRKLRRRPTPADVAEFRTKKVDLRRNAATQEQLNPVSFSLRIAGPKQYKTTKPFITIIRYSARRRLPLPPFLFPPPLLCFTIEWCWLAVSRLMTHAGPRPSVLFFCLTVREVVWPLFHYFGMYMCAGFLGGSP